VTKDGKRRELQVKVGEQVLFTSYAGEEFKILVVDCADLARMHFWSRRNLRRLDR